jgi:hypothetical protein
VYQIRNHLEGFQIVEPTEEIIGLSFLRPDPGDGRGSEKMLADWDSQADSGRSTLCGDREQYGIVKNVTPKARDEIHALMADTRVKTPLYETLGDVPEVKGIVGRDGRYWVILANNRKCPFKGGAHGSKSPSLILNILEQGSYLTCSRERCKAKRMPERPNLWGSLRPDQIVTLFGGGGQQDAAVASNGVQNGHQADQDKHGLVETSATFYPRVVSSALDRPAAWTFPWQIECRATSHSFA